MTTFSPEQMMAIARMMTRKYMPYMQAAVMGLIPRETPGLGTMGVTRSGVLMWDPEWISTLPLEQVSGVLLHEANHSIRSHASRAKTMAAEPKIWNVAADCEINDDLSEANVPLPTNGCWPKTFGLKNGLLAETYYHELMKKLDEDGNLKGAPSKPTAAGGMDGSGSGGAPLPGESPEDADGTASEGRSEADLQRIRNQVASAIEAETRTKGEGSVPLGLRIWAEEHLAPPKIRWEDQLRRAIRSGVAAQIGMKDYTYQHRSRRQAMFSGRDGQIIIPAIRAPLPQVCVGLDTSGSMLGEALKLAASEIDGILKSVRAAVQFIACDSEVHHNGKIKSALDFLKAFKGGGGTSFVPAFDAVERMKPKPPLFVFLTDGAGEAPATPPPGIRVIWVLCGKNAPLPHTTAGPLSWGQIIHIDND